MSITPPALPASYSWGFVVGQVIHAIADTAGDVDRLPQARAATGTIRFEPLETLRKVTAEPAAFVAHEVVTATLGTTGELVDADGQVGIWLVTGDYRVSFAITGAAIPGFNITVTDAHTLVAPLDLVTVGPYTPPTGAAVTTLLVPAGPAEGQVLGWVSGALTWVSAPPPGAHTHTIADTAGLQDALDGKQPVGSYAPALGADDNYVTDAEKAALHTHPAVIAQGATAAAARAAIGAGTSNFSGAYADLSGKPTLGTAAATAATDYATAAQGAKADTALQPSTAQAINAQTGTAYTLAASDAGKLVTLTNAAAITLTVPGSVFTTGQRVDCIVAGAGMVTAVGSGCTVNGTPSLVSRAQWSAFTVLFTSPTTAVMIGDLA